MRAARGARPELFLEGERKGDALSVYVETASLRREPGDGWLRPAASQ